MNGAILTPELLVSKFPRLWHMAEEDSWPSIQERGLMSTTALLDLYGVEGEERDAIEAVKRTRMVSLSRPGLPTVWIRDNLPVNETVLRRTLVGVDEPEFYRMLNSRVFFWVNRGRLDKLRNAGAYKGRRHDILEIDTALLVHEYEEQIELSHLNSGAVHPAANYPRGSGTFRNITDYRWRERLAVNRAEPIVELTIPYAVPDIHRFVLSVETQ